ncbi:MAG TPA: DUF4350 domain-containing protein [Planctomycetota bacterium]
MRLKLRTEHFVILGSGAALMAGVLLVGPGLTGAGRDPKDEMRASSHYTTPSGGKALFALLRDLGFDARRHERKLGLLPRDARALFLIAPKTPLDAEEIREAVAFVEQGGTLVAAGDEPLSTAFGVKFSGGDPATVESGGRRYALASEVVDLPRGRGRFVALADAKIASNRGLREGDHAEYLVHLAARARGPVFFDEFHHGFQGGQTATAILMDSPLGGAVWIALIAAYLGVLAAGRRLGPPVDPHLERRRKPREYLDAFAGVCAKLRAGPQAAGLVAAEFRHFLRTRFGAATPDAAARVAARFDIDPAEVARVADALSALEKAGRAGERELVDAFRDVERLRRQFLDRSQRRTPA